VLPLLRIGGLLGRSDCVPLAGCDGRLLAAADALLLADQAEIAVRGSRGDGRGDHTLSEDLAVGLFT